MKTAQVKNRWLIALAAVGIHISIGSVYAWSVFSNPLHEAFGWDLQQISLTFGIAIFFLGASAAVMGHVVEKKRSTFHRYDCSDLLWCWYCWCRYRGCDGKLVHAVL